MPWIVTRSDEIYHHGILGQKWGDRNGPPYPLDRKDYSANEKRLNLGLFKITKQKTADDAIVDKSVREDALKSKKVKAYKAMLKEEKRIEEEYLDKYDKLIDWYDRKYDEVGEEEYVKKYETQAQAKLSKLIDWKDQQNEALVKNYDYSKTEHEAVSDVSSILKSHYGNSGRKLSNNYGQMHYVMYNIVNSEL